MSEVRITAEPRDEFGKGAARRTRRAGKVPAVMYGHGAAPRHISLPGHELMLALKTANVLFTLDIDGKEELALPKSVQRDPVRGTLEHVDLIVVRRGERVNIELPVIVVGEVNREALLDLLHPTVTVETEATHIPTGVEVDVEGLTAGSQITAGQLKLPSGTTLVTDAEALVVNVSAAPTAADVEAELAEAEAEVGIVHEAPAAESDEAAPAEGGAEASGEG